MDLKERAKQLKADLPAVFLSLKDSETPWLAKGLAALTVIYALSPIDLIPDFIPLLGYLDDVIILPLLIAITIRLIPASVWEKNRQAGKHLWDKGQPNKWYYGIPFILIWLGILWWIIYKLRQ